jgi:membrane fusion protein, multidrug efflux system
MRKQLLAAAVIGLAAVGLIIAFALPALENTTPPDSLAQPAGHAEPGVPVFAAAATAENVPIVLRGIGAVQAFNTVTIKSRVNGNIVKVGFHEGQHVKRADLLFQIDPRPYQAQLDEAQANKAKDEANLANAKLILARYAALLPTHLATTQQQYDTQKAQVAQLVAAVQDDQAQIDAAKLNVAYCAIASPIDGITGLRLVDIGNLIEASAATPLVVVTQVKPIFLTFTLPEQDLDRIRQAMANHPLSVLAYDGDDKRQLAAGLLKVVNNEVDQQTGMVTLKAEFANRDAVLWPGEFVNAHLVMQTVKNGVVVPLAAVQTGPTGRFVYVIGKNSRVAAQPVTVLQTQAGTALIGKGLKAGQKVVTSGQFKLAPGVAVAAEPEPPGSSEIGLEGIGSGIGAMFGGAEAQ